MGFHFKDELESTSKDLFGKTIAIVKVICVIVISMFLIGGKWNG